MAIASSRKLAPVAQGYMGNWWIWLGIIIGLTVLGLSELELKWFAVLFLGLLVVFAGFFFIDKKPFFLSLLVLTIPVIIHINFYYQPSEISRSTYGFQILLFDIPLLALYILWLSRAILNREPLAINITGLLPLAGLFFSASISILLSSNQLYGAFDLFALFFSALLYVYMASQIRTRGELWLVVCLLLVNIVIQGSIALGQYLTNSNLGLDFFGATKVLKDYASLMALSRAGGTLGHPNSLAQFFDLTIPLAFSLLFVPMPFTRRFLLLLVIGIGLIGLTVTLSRGGMLSVGVALLVLMTIHLSRWFGKTQAMIYVLLIVVIGGSIILGTSNPIRQRFLRHDYGAAFGRLPHMQVALNVIRSNPLFGVGLNNYCEEGPKYDNTPQQIMALWKSPAHNLYLFISSEIGLVGMAWILIFIFSVLRSLWPALKSPDPFLYAASLGVLLGFIAFFIHGQFDYTHWSNFTVLWFMLGFAVSLGWIAAQAQTIAPPEKTP